MPPGIDGRVAAPKVSITDKGRSDKDMEEGRHLAPQICAGELCRQTQEPLETGPTVDRSLVFSRSCKAGWVSVGEGRVGEERVGESAQGRAVGTGM